MQIDCGEPRESWGVEGVVSLTGENIPLNGPSGLILILVGVEWFLIPGVEERHLTGPGLVPFSDDS